MAAEAPTTASPVAVARPVGARPDLTPANLQRPDLMRALRAGGFAGLVAVGLFLPLIGLKTVQNIHNELELETRWPLLVATIALIALGRFLHVLLIAPWIERRAAGPRPAQAGATGLQARMSRTAPAVTLALVVVYPVVVLSLAGFQGATKWIDNFGIQILIYVVLGWGLNIVVGLTGLLDLGYAAFYAVGA